MSITAQSGTPIPLNAYTSNIYRYRAKLSDYISDFMIALCLYLPTIFFVPHYFYLVALSLIFLKSNDIELQKRDIFLFLFALFAFVNIFFHADQFSWNDHGSSVGIPLVILTAISARGISYKTFSWLIVFVCCEVFVGAFEYSIGQVALFSAQVAQTGQEISSNSTLLYDIRVYGLSDNSSVLAEKIFLAVLLLLYRKDFSLYNIFKFSILFFGLFISFNRTAILSTFIVLFFMFFVWSLKSYKRIPLLLLTVLIVSAAIFSMLDSIMLQFTRGSGSSSYSEESRLFFIISSLQHVYENPIFGNGSLTFRVFDPTTYTFQHAHNSLIMLIATHGLLISSVMLLFLLGGMRKDALIFVLAMFIFSLTQYSFFWNVSLSDLVLHYFLRGRQADQGNGRSTSAPS